MAFRKIIVMGVSGSGKSLVANQLATALNYRYIDADDFHTPGNISKMANGIPLNDADRESWLDDLVSVLARDEAMVLACSALKTRYRDRLRSADPSVQFLYLKGDIDVIWPRLVQRQHHYFSGKDMLLSQFEQLEEPDDGEATVIDIARPPEAVLEQCMGSLR